MDKSLFSGEQIHDLTFPCLMHQRPWLKLPLNWNDDSPGYTKLAPHLEHFLLCTSTWNTCGRRHLKRVKYFFLRCLQKRLHRGSGSTRPLLYATPGFPPHHQLIALLLICHPSLWLVTPPADVSPLPIDMSPRHECQPLSWCTATVATKCIQGLWAKSCCDRNLEKGKRGEPWPTFGLTPESTNGWTFRFKFAHRILSSTKSLICMGVCVPKIDLYLSRTHHKGILCSFPTEYCINLSVVLSAGRNTC